MGISKLKIISKLIELILILDKYTHKIDKFKILYIVDVLMLLNLHLILFLSIKKNYKNLEARFY
jgi:hypothetical protein